ncbi:cadherin-related family member 1-like [Glandiceps talaboti]
MSGSNKLGRHSKPVWCLAIILIFVQATKAQDLCKFIGLEEPAGSYYEDGTSAFEEELPETIIYTMDVAGEVGNTVDFEITACGEYSGPEPPTSSSIDCDGLYTIVDNHVTWGRTYDLENETAACRDDFTIEITCTETYTGGKTMLLLELKVYDTNDFDPEFVGTPYQTDLSEFSAVGVIVYTGYGSNHFEVPSVNTPDILLAENVDYEIDDFFNLTLMVDDTQNPVPTWGREVRNSTTQLHVNILDGDDCTPIFTSVRYNTEVYENQADVLLSINPTLEAYDQDTGIAQPVYYSFADPERQYDDIFEFGNFSIDNITADITVIKELDRESLKNGEITVALRAAQDDTRGYLLYAYRHAHTTLIVTVLDVNDNPPIMSEPVYYGQVTEHSPKETIVCDVMATDFDEGENAVFIFVLGSDSYEGIFSVDEPMSVTPNTAISSIRVNDPAMLDAESLPDTIKIEVYAVETRTEERFRSNSSIVNITIIDINDNSPVFLDEPYITEVYEDITEETFLIKINASDEDSGPAGEVVFSIWSATDNGTEIFTIDWATGDLYATYYEKLNADLIDSYTVFVMATDMGLYNTRTSDRA